MWTFDGVLEGRLWRFFFSLPERHRECGCAYWAARMGPGGKGDCLLLWRWWWWRCIEGPCYVPQFAVCLPACCLGNSGAPPIPQKRRKKKNMRTGDENGSAQPSWEILHAWKSPQIRRKARTAPRHGVTANGTARNRGLTGKDQRVGEKEDVCTTHSDIRASLQQLVQTGTRLPIRSCQDMDN